MIVVISHFDATLTRDASFSETPLPPASVLVTFALVLEAAQEIAFSLKLSYLNGVKR